ncbi:MAG: alpha/beta hydrolase [Mesorhizobium sp.]|uniref:alpha/beta hydrolase n=2 Tax=unclassified Mesorhizobium TaxID=325217 RepID=UPI000FE6CEDF|nr:MAG: alpha/beta hydrolase [Mesorhizobium sp.]RWH36154.1 MAG: alpha/beta hydrolase [Mesorhizobium sp.]TIM71078.1 MAG: alpha/beta hydrolase [Mesorhizobium sp.]TIR59793.1 MAG: alpha/beta hydrolase [Mesorhizobium sp.]TIR69241.1 MAG: alpha/beta hydrolase [Mesorhizobium sp.]
MLGAADGGTGGRRWHRQRRGPARDAAASGKIRSRCQRSHRCVRAWDAKAAPVLVFIHGGAWTRNTREDASYPAPTFVSRGAAYAAPDFGSVNTLTLRQMVENCRRAVEWTMKNAASFGGDPNRVYVAGHSSGAHLAACVLITDWTERSLPADALKGGLLMSGMYDLYPVMLSSRSSYLHLTEGGRGGIQPDAPSRPDHLPDCRRVSRPGQSGVQAPVRCVR